MNIRDPDNSKSVSLKVCPAGVPAISERGSPITPERKSS